jgi:arginase
MVDLHTRGRPDGPVEVIGVPFDGMGRPGAQSAAPMALRRAGLMGALRPGTIDGGDIVLPAGTSERGPTGFANETALTQMVTQVRTRVHDALRGGRFPLLVGGDCAVLFGAIPALADVGDRTGLVFVDGHEDAYPLRSAPGGEAASTELGVLLGRHTSDAVQQLLDLPPAALPADRVAVLGPRDLPEIEARGVPTLEGSVHLRRPHEVRGDPGGIAREACSQVAEASDRWWFHVDLDVLDKGCFVSCGDDFDPPQPGGLEWSELETVVRTALRMGCSGWSLSVFNPARDEGGADARRIVELVRAAFAEQDGAT